MKKNTRRGRPKGSRNKKSFSLENLPTEPIESFNYDTLRDDHGILAPKEVDIEEELSLMRTRITD